jgi:hypothetical protein
MAMNAWPEVPALEIRCRAKRITRKNADLAAGVDGISGTASLFSDSLEAQRLRRKYVALGDVLGKLEER